MGSSFTSNRKQDHKHNLLHNAPFNIQVPSSLRDPNDTNFPIEELENLNTTDKTRDIALGYLHDHEKFASLWRLTRLHRETRRWMRKFIQIQTINAVCNGFYRLPGGNKVELDINKMIYAAENTKQYSNDYEYDRSRQQHSFDQLAEIFVINGDCLDTVLCFKEKYPNCNPVVLNMANAKFPGGGWRNGCGAQEENLHRRTNLFQCLEDSYHQFDEKRDWKYPIPDFGGLYSPDVSVFRGSESQGYPFFPNGPEYISCIACAAYSYPDISTNNDGECELANKELIQNTKKKMKTILKIALENNHDIVILSAFGCGAFRNPPRHIDHNPHGNIAPFADVFNVPILTIDELKNKLS